jgi:hypothetical protein
MLSAHEGSLKEAAKAAGYQPGDRQYLQLMGNDGTLRSLKDALGKTKSIAFNYAAMTPEDQAAAADIQKQITMMLQ